MALPAWCRRVCGSRPWGQGPPAQLPRLRAACRGCRVSHALLPAFVLARRLDAVAAIGAGLAWAVGGRGMRPIAAALGVPHSTARDWRRRFRARAPTLVAGLAALAVELAGSVPALPADPEAAALA